MNHYRAIYKVSDNQFKSWQNDIKEKCNEFRRSVDRLHQKPTQIPYFDVFEPEAYVLEDEIDCKHEVIIFIQEVEYLESEINTIISLISASQFRNHPRVKIIRNKINEIKESIRKMKDRAYSIKSQYYNI